MKLIIRRAISILLFLIGGALSMLEVGYGFMGVEGFLLFNLLLSSLLASLAVPVLAAAAWISPGERWRDLGLTVWIGAAGGLALAVYLLIDYYDPGSFSDSHLPVQPALLSGTINLLIVVWIGWVLYGGRERIQLVRERAGEWIIG